MLIFFRRRALSVSQGVLEDSVKLVKLRMKLVYRTVQHSQGCYIFNDFGFLIEHAEALSKPQRSQWVRGIQIQSAA